MFFLKIFHDKKYKNIDLCVAFGLRSLQQQKANVFKGRCQIHISSKSQICLNIPINNWDMSKRNIYVAKHLLSFPFQVTSAQQRICQTGVQFNYLTRQGCLFNCLIKISSQLTNNSFLSSHNEYNTWESLHNVGTKLSLHTSCQLFRMTTIFFKISKIQFVQSGS